MLLASVVCATALTLKTTSASLRAPAAVVHDFLATPANWPSIVLSSWSVEGDVSSPAEVGSSVDEIFGAPPVLPLRVSWSCASTDRDRGALKFVSEDGLPGVASNCVMEFAVIAQGVDASTVDASTSRR